MSIVLRLFVSLVVLAPSLASAATLESPGNGANLSGIGVIRGWKCEAVGDITVRLDGGDPVALVYGNERGDTSGVCGDTNNGFVAIYNWALLGDGTHTAVAYDNGVEFARSTFAVTTLGTQFLQDASREVTVFDFPELGTDVVLEWQAALQNFVITDRVESPLDALSGSRLYWAANTDTVYWSRTDRSAAGSISLPESDGRIVNLAIDSVEDKLYLAIITDEGGAIHRVNLDGTQYEEVWVYESIGRVSVHEISLDARGDMYLSISSTNVSSGSHTYELKRFSIEEALSYPGDGPPKTLLRLSSDPNTSPGSFALQTVYDTAQIEILFGGYDTPRDIHIIGDTMYFHINGRLYRARTDGSGVRTEYSPPRAYPDGYESVESLEIRDGILWWFSYEDRDPDTGHYSSRIYRRQMGAAPGSEELVPGEFNFSNFTSMVVAPIDHTIYLGLGGPISRYQQGAESPEVYIEAVAVVLELAP